MKPPIAKRVPFERELHDSSWTDHYHWLRASNWRECIDEPSLLPEDISQYLHAENDWFEHCMADTKALQKELLEQMRSRIQDVEQSLPDAIDQWCYLDRYQEGAEHPQYVRYAKHLVPSDTEMQVLIDFNKEALAHAYFDPGDAEYSPTHTHLVWSMDNSGAERYSAYVRNLATGLDEDIIEDVDDITWGSSEYLFYTKLDEDHRSSRIYRHRLGTSAQDDVLIFHEADNRFSCSVWVSLSAKYVFISVDTDDQSECWYIPCDELTAAPRCIEPRASDLEYSVEHVGDVFYLLTNADGAENFKLMSVSCQSPERANWQDWLVPPEGVMVLDVYAYQDWLMWLERENGLPRICYCRLSDETVEIHTVKFNEQAYALSLEPLLEFDSSVFRFSYQSPSTPEQTFSLDMHNGERILLKEDVIPCGHNPEQYLVQRLSAQTSDNQSVPVTVLFHVDTIIDGTAPCFLTAYGAYGSSIPACFSSSILSLVDRGFVYAIAHVRGGQEKGRAWYDGARGNAKQNTFDDVVAVAHRLIGDQFTGTGKIVLSGGSAGGLMAGAVINQCEHLWAGVIADVPFVDVVNTLIDDSLPLTPGEWSQWGNPLNSVEEFDVIRQYSPYDNVQSRPYPPMYVTAGVSDPRVTYWEPAKWVAQHRHVRDDNNLLMLKTHMSTGHFGESGRYASLGDEAIAQAFALKVTQHN